MKSIATATFSILLTVSAALSACGGGGGAATPAAPGAASPAPAAVTAPAAPGAAGYAANSPQGASFELLNSERSRCGFGSLMQNAALDQAAAAHARFLVERGVQYGHYEADGEFFAGVTEQERVFAAGYRDSVGAVLAVSTGPIAASQAFTVSKQIRALYAAPYHLLNLLDGWAEVGVGYASKVTGTNESKALNVTLGRPGSGTQLDADSIYTYPCEGSTGVNVQLAPESPSAIPANLSQDKLFGTPIAVKVRTGKVLVLTSATITPTAGGSAVPAQIVSMANTPQPALMRSDSAYVLPISPLTAGASYSVQLAGTSNGTTFAKAFLFTTAN
jgi:uncharacterized protein YkwD